MNIETHPLPPSAARPFLRPQDRGVVQHPGLPLAALDAGEESYFLEPGNSIGLDINEGEHIELVDIEGGQALSVLAISPDGKIAPELLGLEKGVADDAWQKALRFDVSGTLRAEFSSLKIDPANVSSARVFSPDGRARTRQTLTAKAPLRLLILSPYRAMPVDGSHPPTSVQILVRRNRSRSDKEHLAPPPPLADPLIDFNLDAGYARAYEVKAGQYIQILDVQGRQCSDFQAFCRKSLDEDKECYIDATATRSMNGAIYPTPGISAKYFSANQMPLVEVIQDSVDRHDTFGVACTRRGYEDKGYFGHRNCSDNLQAAARPYPIAERLAWPAINLFFNTKLNDGHLISSDDPYSRPGDYILMRATRDLVCFSTSCPDDISPTNAWDPTDIQVRVYESGNDFRRAKGFRMTPSSPMKLTKNSGFHEGFERHTRNFAETNGYWLAQDFTGRGALEEYWACREKAALIDMSALRKYDIAGPDAFDLVQYCMTRDAGKLATGQIVYTPMCYENGGVMDDGTMFRLGDMHFRWIGGSDVSGLWLGEQAGKMNLDVWVRNSTDQLHNVAVQGPRSREMLREIIWTPPTQPNIDELRWFHFTIGRLGDYEGMPVIVSRTGFTGELGYELFCHPDDAMTLFDALWQAGEPYEMSPMGLDALDMLRVEAGLVLAGREFCDQTDPFEAGIGFTVPLAKKNDDFIGREALERRKANPQRRLVGLEIDGSQLPEPEDCVHIGRAQVGTITSPVRSPYFNRVIALARIDEPYAEIGKEVEVGRLDGAQKRLPAKIVPFPFYDPKKERVRV